MSARSEIKPAGYTFTFIFLFGNSSPELLKAVLIFLILFTHSPPFTPVTSTLGMPRDEIVTSMSRSTTVEPLITNDLTL
ncbi:MAG: hypothetical protein ACD_25C00248G0002 [uncultured bacterium]|nr:MAG: hypothetical protein ACD_25C00248G0002 [uncultured bacterium]